MTKRAEKAMMGLYDPKQNPAIAALVEFAAQNSGIESANYFQSWQDRSGVRAYRSEARSIGDDWKRFKEALAVASMEGVTDAEVIAEAPHAFAGRLEPMAHCSLWGENSEHYPVAKLDTEDGNRYYLRTAKDSLTWMFADKLTFGWNYCIGQYFPTEYRKAAATLLEYATRLVRRSRPATKAIPQSIAELQSLNEKNGGCWFGKAEKRFFGTRIESGIIKGRFFISSEQPPHGSRKYSIRTFDDEGSIDTVGEFCAYDSKREALDGLNAHLAEQNKTATQAQG